MSNHLPAAWCDCCGLLVATSDIENGLCSDCRDDGFTITPPSSTDAEIERAMDRMDRLFGDGWLEK